MRENEREREISYRLFDRTIRAFTYILLHSKAKPKRDSREHSSTKKKLSLLLETLGDYDAEIFIELKINFKNLSKGSQISNK